MSEIAKLKRRIKELERALRVVTGAVEHDCEDTEDQRYCPACIGEMTLQEKVETK